jgi:hypothetical protein
MSKATKKPILMNSVVCSTSKQQNILSMFTSAAKPAESKKKSEKIPDVDAVITDTIKAGSVVTDTLTSEDPTVAAFYKSLTPAEMTAHRIATVKLGTSYDVTRTRGFMAWSKARGST